MIAKCPVAFDLSGILSDELFGEVFDPVEGCHIWADVVNLADTVDTGIGVGSNVD